MNAATATLPEQVELSVTRLAHVLFRGAGPGLSRSAASALHRIATAGPQRITELAVFKAGEEEPAATGWFVHVFVDRRTRRPVAFPPRLRDALERLG